MGFDDMEIKSEYLFVDDILETDIATIDREFVTPCVGVWIEIYVLGCCSSLYIRL